LIILIFIQLGSFTSRQIRMIKTTKPKADKRAEKMKPYQDEHASINTTRSGIESQISSIESQLA